ncbi:MAG: RIP metalloprotease RseP [Candidatus Paracaedibacteraceae bacterium]|nr:RIP metalloprotease RseP [Candidatus Paracaedibacteraceae bacterium]
MIETLLSMAQNLWPFLVLLTILVFIHELGHYLVARWNGVKIEVFSIGFGPELFGWTDKADTRWKFSLIPLGGYVKMYGDADAASKPDAQAAQEMSSEQKALTLQGKRVGQKIAVVAAGPAANYVLAIAILAGLYMVKGVPIVEPIVGSVVEQSVAGDLGLKAKDKILSLNGKSIESFDDLRLVLPSLAGKPIELNVERDQKTVDLKGKMERDGQATKSLGITPFLPDQPLYKDAGVVESVWMAVDYCWDMSVMTLKSLGQMLMGNRSSGELGGILSIGDMAKKSASQGWISFILLTALLSINLGLINLLPIPVLDGGHIVFYSIEGIIGRPVSDKAQEIAYTAGLMIVLTLMAVATWNDLSRFKIVAWFMKFFN